MMTKSDELAARRMEQVNGYHNSMNNQNGYP